MQPLQQLLRNVLAATDAEGRFVVVDEAKEISRHIVGEPGHRIYGW